ncbi:hypothetical protein [Roseinatronobacter bogoriensis]|uniref:Uncharacterized protein n=1 Tax=Roseinatronobacter bogoriensis subsp. barguzinensis TaxID=441209 RepID=A0A2K8KA37_9RHOB|nr:hypothetical protein [Rhodobaca]ATX64565.1 hypothetical protein BG454_00890 [Rhodobaca barguzinensis]MBB4209747.1 hypothetical protein [Rhodobaca bogoriensis DSM 18756]TDW33703.1 hypothetical protein LY39_03536 [Rhodobaca barguzinensis]TDY66173.1 hypothetical protein EV660_11326 [Rhodobaca bogoriensis DSM 18756]
MTLPQREYFTIEEVAVRWECTIADIAGLAVKGKIDIVTGIPPVRVGDEIMAGEVVIAPFDILPVFRRCCTAPKTIRLGRMRPPDHPDWRLVTAPEDGVEVYIADLLLAGAQVYRFEDQNTILRRLVAAGGSSSPYDWEGMLQALALHLHEHGVPASQSALVAEMQEWFVLNSNGDDVPDERSIRRRITPLWQELKKKMKS